MPQEFEIELKYSNRAPVELTQLTAGFEGIAQEYQKFLKRSGVHFSEARARLYLKEIRRGSIIAKLIAMTKPRSEAPPVETPAYVAPFYGFIKTCYEALLDERRDMPDVDKGTLKHLSAIVEPVVHEGGAQLTLTPPAVAEQQPISITANQARVVKRSIAREIQRLDAPSTSIYSRVELHWYQARNDRFSQAGDRAVIAVLSERPTKVLFANENLKARMLLTPVNPFQLEYTVDVTVDFVGRVPKLFLISLLHESRPLGDVRP